ncbi:flagellar hook protein FlgE [Clostridium cylindrosporum]|uniref:Flagellar hook protein FlgE n=1 Tax=Clostridium cylindrosporum DSM 605 TaxID=1121307 RepID=A0A0J8D741_CLOCY|nr:flagellar hook-basal body complex protein [Clostridium cylindrosporum]KMT21707.1 flagellar hook protein FlgE [Clostridium cylindrosporum DSM 605]
MIRSMYSGISGMKNQQVKMDTIGNNIANLSTTSFKGSRVTFKDALTQTMQSASAPTFAVGGANPRQVGLGMAVSSVDKNMAQGTLQPTGRSTDIAIQGSGYFMVQNGPEVFYTRDGSFTLDKFGDLVTSEGLRVMGQDKAGTRGPINLPLEHDTVPAIKIQGTVGASTKELLQIKLYGFDGAGIEKINIDNTVDGGANPVVFKTADKSITINIKGYSSLTELERAITTQLKNIGEMSEEQLKATDAATVAKKDIKENIIDKGIYGIGVTGDYAEAKNATGLGVMPESRPRNTDGTINTAATTGFYTEKMQIGSFSMGKDGTIRAVYGEDVFEVARLEIAKFVNDSGLEAKGSNLYRETANSGQATKGFPGDIGFGTSEQGFLEMSNVDLANEFTDMIVTSRSYQANSKTITTSDEMLQELLNLKR